MELRYTVIMVTLIICLFFVWFFSHKAKHQEKMLRIEMGITDATKDSEKNIFSHSWLKLAFLVIGQGLALLIVSILATLKWINNDGLTIAIFALMGGISMLVAHRVVSKKQKN